MDGVRSTGRYAWLALCPSHDDRSPSLAIKLIGDRLLVHCFGGCSVYAVVESAGLTIGDLFEQTPRHGHATGKGHRSPFSLRELFGFCAGRIELAALLAGDIAQGRVDVESGTGQLLRIAGDLRRALDVEQ